MTRFAIYSWLIGFTGGFCLFYEQVPLAWLLGSMVATSVAALSGLQVETLQAADALGTLCSRSNGWHGFRRNNGE